MSDDDEDECKQESLLRDWLIMGCLSWPSLAINKTRKKRDRASSRRKKSSFSICFSDSLFLFAYRDSDSGGGGG